MTGHSPRGTVVFDLDGVVYLDTAGVPGAADTMQWLLDEGWQIRFATNNSSKTQHLVALHVAERTGFTPPDGVAVTSGMAASRYAAHRHRDVFVVGSDALRETLEDHGMRVDTDRATAVVAGLDRDLSYNTLDRAVRLIRNGAEFIATNIDATYPTPTGLAPGAGAIVAAIEAATDTRPVNCGKPTQPFLDVLLETIEAEPVWMVGDRPETDLALAHEAGWTAVLTLSGVTRDPTEVPDRFAPHHVIPSIAELPGIMAR